MALTGGGARREPFTMLPGSLRAVIASQVDMVRRQHGGDVHRGGRYVVLPDAFDRKSATAARDWRWAWSATTTARFSAEGAQEPLGARDATTRAPREVH